MVTSQEAIDSVVKISGDDFLKIQGRFNTHLSLSSQSVDEVIKKRILEKTSDADKLLQLAYDKEHAVLKNLDTFNSGKKNGFKALMYLHRYSRDLLAKLRTDYVHEQQERYSTQFAISLI